ncbi:MAG TPA: S41 family peptidase [Gemmatimonadaceae bacterium]|nr:S41 family peptidase [Gemmatimonadaceae bacterium]
MRGIFIVAALALAPRVPRIREADALAGQWRFTISAPERGEMVVRMRITEAQGGAWTAASRLGAARAFVPWWKYQLGRLTGKVPDGGSLVVLDAHVSGPGRFRGAFRSEMIGKYTVDGTVGKDRITGVFRRDSSGASVGTFFATRDAAAEPVRDYRSLARTIADTLVGDVFDPRLARTEPWKTFLGAVARDMSRATDDLDAMAAFYSNLPGLGLSHVELVRDPVLARLPIDSLTSRVWGPPDSLVRFQFIGPGVGYMLVRKWDAVTSAIDRAFRRLDSARANALIIDLRGNPGGDNSAGAPLAHLFRDTTYAGVLLTNKWFSVHAAPPTVAELSGTPLVTRDEGIEIVRAIRANGAVRAGAVPRAPYFAGKVYVLIDGRSASASEPIAHHLRSTGRATLIGQRTAGAMLMHLPHDLGDGWVLLVPEADFYAANGARLEGHGVMPDIVTPSREALVVAAREIAKADAHAGAVVESIALVSLGRWMASVDAYRRAITTRPEPNIRATLERTIKRRLGQAPDDKDAKAALEALTAVRDH